LFLFLNKKRNRTKQKKMKKNKDTKGGVDAALFSFFVSFM